jgi:hypothetical protein
MFRGTLAQIITLLSALSAGLVHAESALPAGFLESVNGSVSLCKYPCAGEFGSLKTDSDAGRILFAGDMIRCQKDGKAVVHASGSDGKRHDDDICKLKDVFIVKRSGYVPQLTVPGEPPSTEVALASYATRAGRDKGSDTPVYSPPENGAVIAREFVIRWRVRPPLPKLTVILRGHDNSELARIDNVDGSLGVLDSDALRQALTKYRDAAPTNTQATLVFKADPETERTLGFSILTLDQERALEKELAHIDPSPGLFRFVERAAVFEAFHLYGEVAAEYDAGLEEAPKSRDMLEAAYNANARIGNLRHAHELLRRIDDSSK